MAELEGRTLDRYELRRIIGKGGMANVYEAYDPSVHRVVAVKVFKREDEEMLRRFVREAEVMAKMHHSHLVEVYDTGEAIVDGVPRSYIVMPLLTGGTLRQRIRRSPLRLSEICQCLGDIAGALDYIHRQNIVHRDIKASNVLLNDEGRCYLTDFGIARITTDATQLTTSGNVLGTVDYVAPELFEIHRRADARSDLYSLGVLLYEMVTGRLPFSADNQIALISMHVNKQPPSPRQYIPQLPRRVEQVMYKALAKDPAERYGSARELTEAFCRAVKGSDVEKVAQSGGTRRRQGELVAEAVGVEQQSSASRGSPSSSASATEHFSFTPASVAGESMMPETPTPTQVAPGLRPSSERPRAKRSAFIALLAFVVLLIVSLPIGYVVLNHGSGRTGQTTRTTGSSSTSGTLTPNPTGTAQSSAATAKARVQATSTAVAASTATAQAQASATAGPLQTATAGQPAYEDALTDSNNSKTQAAGWDQNSQCSFAGDGYHVKQPASIPYFKGCREHNNIYGDMALSVDVILLSGHSGGVFFRLTTNLLGNYDGYLFEIDSQGQYKISREQGAGLTVLQDWILTSYLQTGDNAKNRLQFIARGDTFLFYINGFFLTQVQDSYYQQANTIGFLATSVSGGDTADVVYSNLSVYTLS